MSGPDHHGHRRPLGRPVVQQILQDVAAEAGGCCGAVGFVCVPPGSWDGGQGGFECIPGHAIFFGFDFDSASTNKEHIYHGQCFDMYVGTR